MPPKVVHCKKAPQGSFVYVGRPSKWGNPYTHKPDGTLAQFQVATVQEAIEAHDKWLDTQPELLAALPELKGHDLACWCVYNGNEPCHARTLLRRANPELQEGSMTPRNYHLPVTGYDTETSLIGPGAIIPSLVCASYDTGTKSGVLSLKDGLLEFVRHELLIPAKNQKLVIASHNAAFEICTTATAMVEAGMDDAWNLWFDVMEAGGILCTIVRERLLNISSHGELDDLFDPVYVKLKYDLATLLLNYCGIDISHTKGEDTWRLRYSELKGLSAKDYPKAAYDYSLMDSIYARDIFYAQEERIRVGRESGEFPGICTKTEEIQTAADACLLLMTSWGACIDTTRKAEINDMLERELRPEKIKLLLKTGILSEPLPARPWKNGTIDKVTGLPKMLPPVKSKKSFKRLRQEIKRVCLENNFPIKLTAKGQELEKAGELLEDGEVGPTTFTAIGDNGTAKEWHCPHSALEDEESEEDEPTVCKVCKKEAKAQGYKLKKILRRSEVICTDKDMIGQIAHLDPVMDQYEDWQGLQKLVTTELPRISGTVVHSPFKILVKTTRTSSFELKEGAAKGKRALYPSWNGQNVDPRVRHCAVPRPGFVYFSVDYAASNLVSLGYTCLKLFGESVLADTINAEIDPHARLASALAFYFDEKFRKACEAQGFDDGQSMEVFKLYFQQKQATEENYGTIVTKNPLTGQEIPGSVFWKHGFPKPPNYENGGTWKGGSFYSGYRNLSKPTGLGYPGGLGPDKFIAFARATYKVIVTREEAVAMREIWKATFTEMPEYLKYISDQLKDPTSGYDEYGRPRGYCYQSPLGMHRARADFCAAANGFGLQTPEAEGVKLATIALQKEIFTNKKSILYGNVRCISLIHDEFFGEVRYEDPEAATARVQLIQSIIQKPMADLMTGMRVGTTGCLMRRWFKSAEAKWGTHNGKKVLVPFDDVVVPEEIKKLRGML